MHAFLRMGGGVIARWGEKTKRETKAKKVSTILATASPQNIVSDLFYDMSLGRRDEPLLCDYHWGRKRTEKEQGIIVISLPLPASQRSNFTHGEWTCLNSQVISPWPSGQPLGFWDQTHLLSQETLRGDKPMWSWYLESYSGAPTHWVRWRPSQSPALVWEAPEVSEEAGRDRKCGGTAVTLRAQGDT